MGKINFTPEHRNKLNLYALAYLFNNYKFNGTIGSTYNVNDILHSLSITTLLNMKQAVDKKVNTLSAQDSWSFSDAEQKKLDELKAESEFFNLVIGWKKYSAELEEIASKKKELEAKISDLKESTKTPEDKIKELEAELATL